MRTAKSSDLPCEASLRSYEWPHPLAPAKTKARCFSMKYVLLENRTLVKEWCLSNGLIIQRCFLAYIWSCKCGTSFKSN